jgi:hypothetical protein
MRPLAKDHGFSTVAEYSGQGDRRSPEHPSRPSYAVRAVAQLSCLFSGGDLIIGLSWPELILPVCELIDSISQISKVL